MPDSDSETEFAFVFQTIATQYDNDNMPNVPANTF